MRILPHQNNGNPIFYKPYLDGRLYVGGSETAKQYPGYMDGAVASSRRIADDIIKKYKIAANK